MAVASRDYYKIGGLIIPFAYRPQFCDGVEPPQGDGETNLLGEETGAMGGGVCFLRWNVISEDVYAWWFGSDAIRAIIPKGELSAPVTELILPDPTLQGDPVEGKPYHGRYDYGIVHRIKRDGQIERRYLGLGSERKPYLMGSVYVKITMIGEVPPV